ncbi:MAG: AIR synthase family protein [Anaerolineales bacterium]|jgi:hydrogenase expression/formation protein HypE
MSPHLPVGKLPPDLLARLLSKAPVLDPRVLQGPGIGLDCAILDMGDTLLALKSDPITFATYEIGWYGVQVNANDIATSGARPRWFLVTLLLPEKAATAQLAGQISDQIFRACQDMDVSVIGGHTEITYGIDRPIFIGTMIGEVPRDRLVTSRGARPGDRILLTKGVPIEATAILAREFPDRLSQFLTPEELQQAQDFLHDPGISVLRDAMLAVDAGRVTAMHDPTEGGLATALWELAEASQCALTVDTGAVPIPDLSGRICQTFDLDPLAAIASGALLLTVANEDAPGICQALDGEGIFCTEIGSVEPGPLAVWQSAPGGRRSLPRPERDAIAKVFEA